MGCLKLHILDEQYKSTEPKVCYINKKLTSGFSVENARRYTFSGKEKDNESGYSYFGARYYDPELSIWLSVDPKADKYWWISPYAYALNNPIKLIDPNGMEVIIAGEQAGTAVADLQKGLENITITRNEKSGKLSVSGTPVTETEQHLFNAINDKNVRVNVTAENSSNINGDPLLGTNGGSFLGTTLVNDGSSTKAVAEQFVNPRMLADLDKSEFSAIGTNMKHEVTEGYQAGLISLEKGRPVPAATGLATGKHRAIYNSAHSRATPQSWASDGAHQLNNIIQNNPGLRDVMRSMFR